MQCCGYLLFSKDSSKIKAQKKFIQNQNGVNSTNAIVGTPNYCEDKINELVELFEVFDGHCLFLMDLGKF